MSAKTVVAVVALAMSAACAAKQPVVGSTDEAPKINRDRNLITQTEIDANPSLKASSALDMIRSLRPQYFADRGPNTIQAAGTTNDPEAGLVHASLNGGRIIPISDLSAVHANEVTEVRFLNTGQAMQKFGSPARSGPIIVVTTTNQ